MVEVAFPSQHAAFRDDPAYGTGHGRRKIMLVNRGRQVCVHLVDVLHHLNCYLEHDGSSITAISGEMLRYPTGMCKGAPDALARFVGTPLAAAEGGLRHVGIGAEQCTHLKDMALLAMRHVRRDERVRIYDAMIEDERQAGQGAWGEVSCNDRLVLRWRIAEGMIVAPSQFSGRPLLRGMFDWAASQLSPDELEAAGVLAKTLFVSSARRWMADSLRDVPLGEVPIMKNACFAAMPERVGAARYLGANRIEPDDAAFEMRTEHEAYEL
jgi:hypothetical protein